jgi:hypothetical protein
MKKIWLLNTEETQSNHATFHMSPNLVKNIWNIEKYDIFIIPFKVDPDLWHYINKVKQLANTAQIITVNNCSKPYFLVDSIINDKKLLSLLKKLGKEKKWQFEPHIQTKKIVALAKLTGIDFQQTDHQLIENGLIEDLNCKAHFKSLGKKINLNTPTGVVFSDLDNLLTHLKKLKANDFKKIILKKTKAAGGFGNLSGKKNALLRILPNWLRPNDKIIIEEFIPLEKTIGALVAISDQEIKFIGADQQIIEQHLWRGLQYPLENKKLFVMVKEKSLALAKIVQQLGARGWLNIDFGIAQKDKKLFGLEINFRHNAFSILVNTFAKQNGYLLYYNGFKTKHKSCSNILHDLGKLTIAGKSILAQNIIAQQGVILVNINPELNTYGAAIFSPRKDYISKSAKLLGQNIICKP